MTELVLKDVSKSFRGKEMIKNIRCSLAGHRFFVLAGQSGCGKSLLLKLIAGREQVTRGEIFLSKQPITNAKPDDRSVGLICRENLNWRKTVRELLEEKLKPYRYAKELARQRILEIAELTGLRDWLNGRATFLSGGLRERLWISRGIMHKPEVVLVDCPFDQLPRGYTGYSVACHKSAVFDKLPALILYASHDPEEAAALGDHVLIMHEGEIVEAGEPTALYRRPKTEFGLWYLRKQKGLNSFSLTIVMKNRAFYAVEGALQFRIATEHWRAIKNYTGQRVQMYIEADHIAVASPNTKKENTVRAVIAAVEPDFHRKVNWLYFNTEATVFRIVACVELEKTLRVGQTVNLSFDMTQIHLCDERTGQVVI